MKCLPWQFTFKKRTVFYHLSLLNLNCMRRKKIRRPISGKSHSAIGRAALLDFKLHETKKKSHQSEHIWITSPSALINLPWLPLIPLSLKSKSHQILKKKPSSSLFSISRDQSHIFSGLSFSFSFRVNLFLLLHSVPDGGWGRDSNHRWLTRVPDDKSPSFLMDWESPRLEERKSPGKRGDRANYILRGSA